MGSSDEHPEEHTHERADLRVDGAADRGTEGPGEHGGDEGSPRPVAPLAGDERHVEHAEPDHGRHDGDDESTDVEARADRRAGHELDCHEPTASRRREQGPRDRAVPELVRHEDDAQQQRENRRRESDIEWDPELQLRIEPLTGR